MPERAGLESYLQAGLKGISLRQAVIANNVANLNTPGFRRNDMVFQNIMAEAIAGNKKADLGDAEAMIFTPGSTPVGDDGNDVSLDVEVGEMVRNGALYKTYVRMLGRMYRQMDQAMRTDSM
ncbi:MAG: flagellar basal body rod protein FlgB [Planctomycetota bacterium]|nr:flagellar basal body rod protein FlgB [Planctomycetota bacterium]